MNRNIVPNNLYSISSKIQAVLFSSDVSNACYSLSNLNAETAYSLVIIQGYNIGSSTWFSSITVPISGNIAAIINLNVGATS